MADIPSVTPGFFNLRALPSLLQRDSPTIFEIGSHNGFHTRQFLQLFNDCRIFAFEPDRRAQTQFKAHIRDPRVVLFHAAVGEFDGEADFFPSGGVNPAFADSSPRDWDHSGSLRRPTGHLLHHPWCKFDAPQRTRVKKLDSVFGELGLESIDFVWADVQGAEVDMIRGGQAALSRTRYLHTEYSNVELYDGQVGLQRILELLPTFRVLVRWENDVLLWNSLFEPPPETLIRTPARVSPPEKLPPPPYVLARPRTGLNDSLCELEKCLRYCEAHGRHLIVDTTRSGLFDHLDAYFELRSPAPMTMRCTDSTLASLNALPAIPECVAHRLDQYTARFSPTSGNWTEDTTQTLITFSFDQPHSAPLLVHEQHWTGPLLSPSFLARMRFTSQAAKEISRRLQARPAKDYIAIHVRNTDYSTEYLPLLEEVNASRQPSSVLICTDHSTVFEAAQKNMPRHAVYRLSTFDNATGDSLHHHRRRDQYDINLQTLTDLVAMAFATEVIASTVTQLGRVSGFTMLAMALNRDRQIAEALMEHCS